MASAIEAAVQTMRLTGAETDGADRLAMARGVMAAASRGDCSALALTEATLSKRLERQSRAPNGGPLQSVPINRGSHLDAG